MTAYLYLVKTTDVGHEAGKLHVVVDGLVDELNAIGVVLGELRVVGGLGVKVEDTIADAERIKGELGPVGCAVSDHLVLLVEVVEESRTIMTAIGLCP